MITKLIPVNDHFNYLSLIMVTEFVNFSLF